jgi:hypothetical protein
MSYTYYPCVRCGFCCRRAPCPYGEQDEQGGCKHLKESGVVGDVVVYRCARYDYIKTRPGWDICPAFGSGCGSTLFNEARDGVIESFSRLLRDSPRTSP